jgi:HAD superfamily hydrolase (TIGR01509 family)
MTDSSKPVETPAVPPLAVLWDYDGTLVDTEPVWIGVIIDLLAEYGVTWSYQQGTALTGLSSHDTGLAVQAAIGDPNLDPDELADRRAAMVVERLTQGPLRWRPGAPELMAALHDAGIPCALVSSSPQAVLDAGLNRMPDWFAVVVNGDDVQRNKPAPDAFLLAAERLGVPIDQTLVVEDSLTGVQAGRASGAVVLAIPDQHELPDAPGQITRDSLAGLDVEQLRQIWAQGHEELSRG